MIFGQNSRMLQMQKLFLAILLLCGVCFLFFSYVSFLPHFGKTKQIKFRYLDEKKFFMKPELTDENVSKMLNDVLDMPPKSPKSIFFIYIDNRRPKPKSLSAPNVTARAACAIESAALHNPNTDIFVLFGRPTYRDSKTDSPTVQAFTDYPNVHLRNVDLWNYAVFAPNVEQWLSTDEIFKSQSVRKNIVEFLIYLTLWHYGGTYLSTDVVVLRSLEELPANYIGAESLDFLCTDVINFANIGIGRTVANYCLNDFVRSFSRDDYESNGLGAVTRALNHICQTRNISVMFDKKRCSDFQVYQPEVFHAIPWMSWDKFFEEDAVEATLNALKNSYIAHIWKDVANVRKHWIGKRSAYAELAAKHCPKVWATVNEYF